MLILGIDPGFATVGFGVINYEKSKAAAVDYGIISTPKDMPFPDRLMRVADGMDALLSKYKPDAVAVEELFFAKNVTNGINVAHARGVILLCARKSEIPLYEYTPMQIKQALTGYGRADKLQIQNMVRILLDLRKIPKPDDAADALAVALCHSQTNQTLSPFSIR